MGSAALRIGCTWRAATATTRILNHRREHSSRGANGQSRRGGGEFSRRRSTSGGVEVQKAKLMLELKEAGSPVSQAECTRLMVAGGFVVGDRRGRFLLKPCGDGLKPAAGAATLNYIPWHHQLVRFRAEDLLPYFDGSLNRLLANSVLVDVSLQGGDGGGDQAMAWSGTTIGDEAVAERLASTVTSGGGGGGCFLDFRRLLSSSSTSEADFSLISKAIPLLRWQRTPSFCSDCGSETTTTTTRTVGASTGTEGGVAADPQQLHRTCVSCRRIHYPAVCPVTITVVSDAAYERCVLVRQPKHAAGQYTAVAGYVEPGESLEESVRREVAEEVGLRVVHQEYLCSHPWQPFNVDPASPTTPSILMLGSVAVVDDVGATSTTTSDEQQQQQLSVDWGELDDARWFSRQEVQQAVDNTRRRQWRGYWPPSTEESSPKSSDQVAVFVPPERTTAFRIISQWLQKSSKIKT